jgi:hypothetical protein
MQLLYDQKTGDYYYVKSPGSDDICYVNGQDKRVIEEKLIKIRK